MILRILFIFLLYPFLLKAQDPVSLQWVNNLGSLYYDHISGLEYVNGNVYICGYYSGQMNASVSKGATDAFIAKFDASGTILWLKSFGGAGEDRAHDFAYDNEGNFIISGYFRNVLYFGSDSLSSIDREDIFVISIDSLGNFNWGKSFGGPGAQSASAVHVDSKNRISLSGYFEQTLQADSLQLQSMGVRNAFVLQLDSVGNCLWAKRMGGRLYDEGLNLVTDEHDNIYLSGYFRDTADFGPFVTSSVFSYDCFLLSLSPHGDWRWLRPFGGGYVDNCPALVYMPNTAQVLAAGWFYNDIRFGTDTILYAVGEEESFMAAFDTLGGLIWSQRIGNEFAELIFDLSVDKNDNILAVGTFDSIIRIGQDTLIARHYNKPTDLFALGFSPNGKYQWGYRAGAEFNDFGFKGIWGDSSTFYLSGNFLNKSIFSEDTIFSNGNYDIYLAKFFLDTTGIKPNPVEIQEKASYYNFKVYPNPAKDYFIIEIDSEDLDTHFLSIFDVNGVLKKRKAFVGKKIIVEIDDLPSGTYFLSINYNNLIVSRSIFLYR